MKFQKAMEHIVQVTIKYMGLQIMVLILQFTQQILVSMVEPLLIINGSLFQMVILLSTLELIFQLLLLLHQAILIMDNHLEVIGKFRQRIIIDGTVWYNMT